MRILVLNHEFPPIGGGGGRAAESICKVLAARGHEIMVLTARQGDLPANEQRDGYEIVRIRSFRKLPFRASLHSMIAYVLAGFWAGLRLINTFKPQVIHVHFAVPAGALAWMLSLLTRIPYVLTVHLGDIPGGVPEKTDSWFRFIFPLTRPIWRSAGARVAVSEFTRRLALHHYQEEILVIHNGLEVDSMRPSSISLHDPPVIVFAGRFMPQKDPLHVVNILNGIKDLSWQCVMIGDGPLLAEVKQAVAESDLQARFTFPGWISPDEVTKWFNGCDILFMPSLSEGLPVVGVQALATGLAIVASRVGGFMDLVDEDRNGHLLEPGDSSGFAAKLQGLLKNPDHLLSLRKHSLQKAKSFEINQIAGQYESLFQEILMQGKGSIHLKGSK